MPYLDARALPWFASLEWVQRCCTELFHTFSPNKLNGSVTQLNRKTRSDHCSGQLFAWGHGSGLVWILVGPITRNSVWDRQIVRLTFNEKEPLFCHYKWCIEHLKQSVFNNKGDLLSAPTPKRGTQSALQWLTIDGGGGGIIKLQMMTVRTMHDDENVNRWEY